MPSFRSKLLQLMMKMRPNRDDVPFMEQRPIIERMAKLISAPKEVTYHETTIDHIPILWVEPPAPTGQVMLYLHGGGYTIGSHLTEKSIIGKIALLSGAKMLVPHYRLAPEHPFPAALDDALTCYRWLLNNGTQPEQIMVGGLSAGGGLTMALLLKLRELGEPLPQAGILISAWLDLTGTAESVSRNTPHDSGVSWKVLMPSVKAYVGDDNVRNPLISPVFADLTGMPPLLIQVGSIEILLDDSQCLAANAHNAGVDVTLRVWDGMIHGWHLYSFVPEAHQAIAEIAAYIKQHQRH
jgi:epsilon-lactone hydrolase